MSEIISNAENVLDSRDINARIEELKAEKQEIEAEFNTLETLVEDSRDIDARIEILKAEKQEIEAELNTLETLVEEARSYTDDWEYGATLIRDSYFKEHAQEFAEEIGAISATLAWPASCIDWERAACELQMDCTPVEFDGAVYWIR